MSVENESAPPRQATDESRTGGATAGKIFVLGDSRTGTFSLHNFFTYNGLASLHYFLEESKQQEPLHLHEEENLKNFSKFMSETTYRCFTDYPTRFYYKYLIENFPDAYFILTTRDSTDRWAKSMEKFFAHFALRPNIESLSVNYERQNEAIRQECQARGVKFIEICIDNDNGANSEKLASFLGLNNYVPIGHDNSSAGINNQVLSSMHRLFSYAGDGTPGIIETAVSPSKSVISEFGWVFLVNDTNKFMSVQFGNRTWSPEERQQAASIITERAAALKSSGSSYYKFIIPEKNVVYREYMPRALAPIEKVDKRPSHYLEEDCKDIVHYLDRYLIDARSYGQLYFRGDSHTNWVGAWFVYCYIIRTLSLAGLVNLSTLLQFKDLVPSVASYGGDLATQIDPHLRKEFDDRWGFTNPKYGFDVAVKLDIPGEFRKAERVETPASYKEWFTTRETLAYERPDGQGLRAVIFRDSTVDFCHDLIAQHFSRSVFVWHQGQVYQKVIEAEKPDIIIHVMAERFVTMYPTFKSIIKD